MLVKVERPKQPSWGRKAVRLWYALRYYRTRQLAVRVLRRAQTWATGVTRGRRYTRLADVVCRPRHNARLVALAREKVQRRPKERSRTGAQRLLERRYRFLHLERRLPDPIDWRLRSWPEAAHLWRFHLHYHEFLLDLLAEGARTGGPAWYDRAWDVVDQWIAGNPLSDPRVHLDAWHPYCISRRLPVWIYAWLRSSPPEDLGRRVLASMFCQARYLEDHLERDLGGNHLLENARALVLVGCFLDTPAARRWRKTGEQILRQELGRQVFSHGEHFERSPMYHAQMLELLLDVRDALGDLAPDTAWLCEATAERMGDFLRRILHPDGEIPLLGDSWLAETASIGRLMCRVGDDRPPASPADRPGCGRPPASSRSVGAVGDYWIFRDDRDFLLFDAGPVGPDHLPAHAHGDLLTLEGSVRGRRVLVDSGVLNYQDDAMRAYCRSSAAHNVLVIDGRDQCDVWSRFRMGYRGWPLGLTQGYTCEFHWARACHDAYRRLGVPRVGRWLACRPQGPWLCVDWANGAGEHELTAFLHLHPDVAAELVAEDEIRLQCHGTLLRLRYLAPGGLTITNGWYCPQAGVRLPALVVRWSAVCRLPAVCGWSLVWGDCDGTASLDATDPRNPVLQWREGKRSCLLRPAGG